jgi:hypothetical protein
MFDNSKSTIQATRFLEFLTNQTSLRSRSNGQIPPEHVLRPSNRRKHHECCPSPSCLFAQPLAPGRIHGDLRPLLRCAGYRLHETAIQETWAVKAAERVPFYQPEFIVAHPSRKTSSPNGCLKQGHNLRSAGPYFPRKLGGRWPPS